MFRWKTLNVLTIFHSPTSAPSTRILTLLQTAAAASKKPTFDLDIIEAPRVPTPSQLTSMLEFLGTAARVGEIVKGAKSEGDAVKILEEGGVEASERVRRPIVVDWNGGRVVIGPDETAVKNLVDTLPKS